LKEVSANFSCQQTNKWAKREKEIERERDR
jgi:hypothetical protein